MRTLVWFRGKDLRVHDHAPLAEAVRAGDVIPLFVLDPFFFQPERAAELPNRMQFLLESLDELSRTLRALGSRLVVVHGRSVETVPRLATAWRVDRVVAHRWVEPFGRERDRRIAGALRVPFDLYEGETLLPPGTLRTGGGTPFSVFTPFSRAFLATASIAREIPAPRSLPPLPADIQAPDDVLPSLAQLGLTRNPRGLAGGERAAVQRLRRFLDGPAATYAGDRDRMDRDGTSRLSQDLKFGTLSVRTVWNAVTDAAGGGQGARVFKNELLWREFAHSTLWDRPELLHKPFRPEFDSFPWVFDAAYWRSWVNGTTGYPVVDAAARQLLGEGFVHNRARMIAASFLTKHLLVDYRLGEEHYMKYLTDGDWAQNNFGWQWSAGCGCDAQAYFRVFNPILQGTKFDPDGTYVKRWVPELERVPARWIHRVWEAPDAVLADAGVAMGQDYPRPVVDHAAARARFLETAKHHMSQLRSR
ncbi:MAG: DNA photolyase family protein [Candidatus Krumholzibacteria bacterium]|nr:DNA photolyase family protein [Candidatus Krumholzibacteria bacterium]MDH5269293.1 DNA photolyase family protein [Candidatus Krumholzibacteria bacterium]